MSYLTAKRLAEQNTTYGGRVTAIVERFEANHAKEAKAALPEEVQEVLTGLGVTPSDMGGVLAELAKALAPHKANDGR